ncbi:MAG TPA: ABC transporter permease [Candidatus Acidoferrales bacterium]|nr:ABC transporter permease [Candidatus Acidoferrales bacterium]
MRLFAALRMAARALRRNKMRTLLTMLGMIFGVGAVIASVSITSGAKSQVEGQIASLGQNVVLVWSGNFTSKGVRTGWGSAGTLTLDDAEAIKTEVSGVTIVSPEVRGAAQVAAGDQDWYTTILGEGADYFDLRRWPFTEGSSFGDQDVHTAGKIAVIGKTVATQLYGNEDPLGKVIRIKNVPFIVGGVLIPKGLSLQGQDQDDIVVVPYTSAMKRVLGGTTLRTINVQAASANMLSSVQQQITDLLRQRHRITPGKDDDFTIRTQQEIAEFATSTATTMSFLLAGVAAVSLLVGGIGIMNIMLVSVTERTREIGIRMAVGARAHDILVQFLIEAVTISIIGGLIGIVCGVSAQPTVKLVAAIFTQLGMPINFLSQFASWPTLTPVTWIAIASVSSAVAGIISGFYPAWKASKLDPIDALRYE